MGDGEWGDHEILTTCVLRAHGGPGRERRPAALRALTLRGQPPRDLSSTLRTCVLLFFVSAFSFPSGCLALVPSFSPCISFVPFCFCFSFSFIGSGMGQKLAFAYFAFRFPFFPSLCCFVSSLVGLFFSQPSVHRSFFPPDRSAGKSTSCSFVSFPCSLPKRVQVSNFWAITLGRTRIIACIVMISFTFNPGGGERPSLPHCSMLFLCFDFRFSPSYISNLGSIFFGGGYRCWGLFPNLFLCFFILLTPFISFRSFFMSCL